MAKIDFYFTNSNLSAAAKALIAEKNSPVHGQPLPVVEQKLMDSAIALFESIFGKSAKVTGINVNDGVLQVPIIWKGYGAIFSADDTVSGGGVTLVQKEVKVNVADDFCVSIDFWTYAD